MRVLMLSRSDVHQVPGGDTIQMIETKANLENKGVEVQLGDLQDHPLFSDYDVIHIFNWQVLEPFLATERWKPRTDPPVVLSPIFWFHTGHWFEEAASKKRSWRIIRRGFGSTQSQEFYMSWQQNKFRWADEGKKFKQSLSMIAQLLPNSETELRHLETVLGLNGKLQPYSMVVPNGVVRELYDPPPLPNPSFREKYGDNGIVLEVARIQSAKNQAGLIQALFDLDIPIVFVGQPSPYEPDYVERCHELANKRGRVYFTGPLPPHELGSIYASAAVHVLPSWRETPGLASLEAAAAGCKVVSTSLGSASDYFGELAWYCDPSDPDSIRQSVIQALESPPSNQLRELVLERYTWDIAAQTTLTGYNLAIEKNKGFGQ
jgi:glycosyltransferase involved in cell wall biosynthesis